ncbi:MAG: ABC transporter substrate-binding protein [Myxococcota bacterium]
MSRLFTLSALCCAIVATLPAAAQADDAQRFLEQKHNAVTRVMQRAPSSNRDAQLTRMLSELLDYRELSRRSLGAHWEAQSDEQKDEFVSLLQRLVERSYRQNLQRTLSFQVAYENAEARGEEALVQTEARSRENRRAPPVSIDYLLRRDGRTWKVVDLTVDDGMSMVQSYRRQFDRIIEREGWDGLIRRMQQRLAS